MSVTHLDKKCYLICTPLKTNMTIAETSSVSIGNTAWWISIVMFVFLGGIPPSHSHVLVDHTFWEWLAIYFHYSTNMIAAAAVAAAKNVPCRTCAAFKAVVESS